jgi:hypothetical protein
MTTKRLFMLRYYEQVPFNAPTQEEGPEGRKGQL